MANFDFMSSWFNHKLLSNDGAGNDRLEVEVDPDLKDRLLKSLDAFNQQRTVEYTPLIELKSIYGVSILRDVTTLTGAAAIDDSGAEIILNANGGTARINSAERGRYLSGSVGIAGIGVRLVTMPDVAGDFAEWGYFNELNGFGFGVDESGLYVWLQRGGVVVEKTYQADWNGEAVSESFDLTDGNVFQMPFLWYGYGSIRFDIIERGLQSDHKVIAHSASVRGSVSIDDPNLPIAARCGGNCSIAIGGRQYGVYGRYRPSRRIVGDQRLEQSVSSTVVPLVSFRDKGGLFESISVKLQGVNIISTANLAISIRLNGTLTGASFRDPTNNTETATEYDISSTAITGGEEIFVDLAAGGSGARTGLTTLDLPQIDIPPGATVSLCARTISTTGSGTVSSVLKDRQEW